MKMIYQYLQGNCFQFYPSTADGFPYAVLNKNGVVIALTDGDMVESFNPHRTLGSVLSGLIRDAYKKVVKRG